MMNHRADGFARTPTHSVGLVPLCLWPGPFRADPKKPEATKQSPKTLAVVLGAPVFSTHADLE